MVYSPSGVRGPDMLYQSNWSFVSTRNPFHAVYIRIDAFEGVRGHGVFLSSKRICGFQKLRTQHWGYHYDTDDISFETEVYAQKDGNSHLNIQTLRRFPRKKLIGKTVLVRFDADLVLNSIIFSNQSAKSTLSTIKYLYNAGAKILLASNWDQCGNSLNTKAVSDHLSSILQLKVVSANVISYAHQLKMDAIDADIFLLENLGQFKQERANCSKFAKQLSDGVDIFVNEAFSLAHKVLASTVGIARFCCTSIAGFHFEERLINLLSIVDVTRRPYIVIVGGGSFVEKKAALHHLLSKCDQMVFVGKLAFQIMHASGCAVPERLVNHHSIGAVMEFVQLAHDKNVALLCPKDFCCVNDCLPDNLDIFPADGMINGWTPVDLGPSSLKEIYSLLLKCKKILWIGPAKFDRPAVATSGMYELAEMLKEISRNNCDLVIVGSAACKALRRIESSSAAYKHFEKASTVWEFLKRKTLPGVAALDRAFPFDLVWETIFQDPTQSLVVDVGSGNGLFLLEMAQKWHGVNFLGLEINEKLVKRCLQNVSQCCLHNVAQILISIGKIIGGGWCSNHLL